jgi:hypothetical protein
MLFLDASQKLFHTSLQMPQRLLMAAGVHLATDSGDLTTGAPLGGLTGTVSHLDTR